MFQAVSLFDEVTVGEADELSVEVSGEGEQEVPLDDDQPRGTGGAPARRSPGHRARRHIALRKSIPVAGGMAGGSADAAGTLVALDALWGGGLTREALDELAAELGSDVPFALHGGTALGRGRGEQLTSVLARGDYHWVFALADAGLVHAGGLRRARRLARAPPTRGRSPRPTRARRAARRQRQGAGCGAGQRPRRWRPCGCARRCADPRAGRELGALGLRRLGLRANLRVPRRSRPAMRWHLAAALSAAGVCRAVRTAHGPVHGARIVATET